MDRSPEGEGGNVMDRSPEGGGRRVLVGSRLSLHDPSLKLYSILIISHQQ